MDYPQIFCGLSDVQNRISEGFSSKTKEFRILKSLLAEDFYFMMWLFNVLILKLRNLLNAIIYWLITYYFLVEISCKVLIISVRAATWNKMQDYYLLPILILY